MSLQAIAGAAYDRMNPSSPSRVAAEQMAAARMETAQATAAQSAAQQVNSALEALKRFIPTEMLALYLPFVAVIQDHYKTTASTPLLYVYVAFLLATPIIVIMLFIAKAVEAGGERGRLPYADALLALIAFGVWGASVPGVFPGNQWWLGLAALVSAAVLPVLQTVLTKSKKPPTT